MRTERAWQEKKDKKEEEENLLMCHCAKYESCFR